MKNFPFVLWMLGFAALTTLSDYVQFLQGKTYSDTAESLAALITLVVWGFVGYKLYEPREK